MNLPFPRSYWVEPGCVLAGCYPGDKDRRVAESKLRGLIASGVTLVINLMEAQEVDHGGQAFAPCWGGRGRTGTVIACHLRRTRGLSAPAALSYLAKLTQHNERGFWPTPETPCQRDFVSAWKEGA